MKLTLKRIFRDVEKVPEMEYIGRFSFYLHQVLQWEECVDDDFENRDLKTYIYFEGKTIVCLISFDGFEKIMNNFKHQAIFGRPISIK